MHPSPIHQLLKIIFKASFFLQENILSTLTAKHPPHLQGMETEVVRVDVAIREEGILSFVYFTIYHHGKNTIIRKIGDLFIQYSGNW
jgi:hypothetical protein